MKNIYALIVLFVFSSCGLINDEVVERSLEDVGEAIIHQKDDNLEPNNLEDSLATVETDTPLLVTVVLSACNGAETVRAECSAELNGNDISIAASALTSEIVNGDTYSTGCGILQVTCDLEALSAGEYTVSYGGSTKTFSLPTASNVVVGKVQY